MPAGRRPLLRPRLRVPACTCLLEHATCAPVWPHLHHSTPAGSLHPAPTPPHCPLPTRRHLGLGSYGQWDEDKRLAFLTAELSGKRPLIPPSMPFSPDAQEVMDTLK